MLKLHRNARGWMMAVCVVSGLAFFLFAQLTASYFKLLEKHSQHEAQGHEYDRVLLAKRHCDANTTLFQEKVLQNEATLHRETDKNLVEDASSKLKQALERCQFTLASAEAEKQFEVSHVKRLELKLLERQEKVLKFLSLERTVSYLIGMPLPEATALSQEDLRNQLIDALHARIQADIRVLQAQTNTELVETARPHFRVKIKAASVIL